MLEILTPHDESLMPLMMGSPCRVPDYAYFNWGLVYTDESPALRAYSAEWSSGNQEQLALVSKATKLAGFGDYPELLRRQTAKAVSELIKYRNSSNPVNILDLGAGPGKSAEAVYQSLPAEIRRNTQITLLDPSADSLQAAKQLMRKGGINYQIVHCVDSDMLDYVKPASVDIITAVASIHHHARIPFEIYGEVLKPGGSLVIADWHHTMWEHPYTVWRFLTNFNWPKRKEGLEHWLEIYPEAYNIPELSDKFEDRIAMEQITRFWLAYKKIADEANLGPNAIWSLEGHRPVSQYIQGMQEAGLSTETPHQILADSTLLMLTVGHKPKKTITSVKCSIT